MAAPGVLARAHAETRTGARSPPQVPATRSPSGIPPGPAEAA
ncbi:predicted protein [Streptomyces sp. SPB78]|nr:predicted protein [Streptomyces sp. SPB78]